MDAAELQALRDVFRQDDFYLGMVSSQARAVLREMIDDPLFAGSTEPPVLAMLGALLRIVQPARVLQLGTHIGFSAVFIGDVLAHNAAPGRLVTVEPNAIALDAARGWIERAELGGTVEVVEGYSTAPEVASALAAGDPFDVAYVDSSHAYAETLTELALIFERGWLRPAGLLALHDAAAYADRFDPTGQGGVRRALEEWCGKRADEYRLLIFEPPLWPGGAGLALVTRRTAASRDPDSRPGRAKRVRAWRRR